MAREYSPDSLGDNTGITFQSSTRSALRRYDREIMGNVAELKCMACEDPGGAFRILAATDPGNEHVQIQCLNPSCRRKSRPFRFMQPQLNDEIARRTGLYLPPSIETEIEL